MAAETASKERFFRYFQAEVAALQDQVARLPSTSPAGGERADAIDRCLAGIARLSSEVKDAASYIPAYDQRTYGEAIKALSEKLQNMRSELGAGPKKFAFKAKKNSSASGIGEAASVAQGNKLLGPQGGGWSSEENSAARSAFATTPLDRLSPGEDKREQAILVTDKTSPGVERGGAENDGAVVQGNGVTVGSREEDHVVVPASAAPSAGSGTVANVRRCVVDLSPPTASGGSFATLTLKNIEASLVVCGRVTGPIHITGVENSVIVTSCRQFRMHGSRKVDVYLHCSSRPIIEDCEEIRFAPLPETYATDETSGSANQWDQIDDFKWLKAEPSPHFSILPEAERIPEDVWKDKVSGGQGNALDDILRAVGVSSS